MRLDLAPSLFPWFAPLPEPMIAHLLRRLERTRRAAPGSLLHVLFELVREKRAVSYFYMEPFVQARLEGGPASVSFSTGWLLKTLGAHSPEKKEPISQKTFSYWRGKGLIRFQQHGLPDYAGAAALYIARLIDSEAERNFLPPRMTANEQDWWCFTQVAPGAPVIPWRASQLQDLPASTFCWTPWLGATWEPGWVRRHDSTIAMRWARIAQQKPVMYNLTPEDILLWHPDQPGQGRTLDLSDEDILQAAASLMLHLLASQIKKLFEGDPLSEIRIPPADKATMMEGEQYGRLCTEQ